MTTIISAHRFFAMGEVGEIVRADGTIWSHGCTLGTRFKGSHFTIDQDVVENFIRVFKTGYPQKIPVDYEHGTVNGATDTGQPVPKAGGVKELRGVYSVSDFDGDLKTAAEKLAERAGRPLDDPRNFGLWVRWSPTPRALQMIREGEYTELSIAFLDHFEHNVTCEDQGPVLVSIALTNLPFLDDMLPVAASRGRGANPGVSGEEPNMPDDRRPTMLARFAAMLGKVFTTEEDAVSATEAEILQLRTKVTLLEPHKALADAVTAAVGETDPAKAAAAITALKATADGAQTATEAAQKTAREAAADKILAKHEKRVTPATKEFYRQSIIRELTAGVAEDKTETEKAVAVLPEHGITTPRQSGADTGTNAPTDDDSILAERATALMSENEQLKELAKTDRPKAYKQALRLAQKEIGSKKQTA